MEIILKTESIIRLRDENGDLYVFGYNPEVSDAEYIQKGIDAKYEKENPVIIETEEEV
jgi:hypothetical protein